MPRPAGRSRLLAALLALLLSASCAAEGRAQARLETASLVITTTSGAVTLTAELARTESEKSAGLMWRKSLADGEGMLFVYDADQLMSFWMKNTLIPLSIAYIGADGRILEIHDMRPQSLRPIRSSRACRHALEVPQGWFLRAGVTIGDRITLP